MIHLLHGKDRYRVHDALVAIRDALADDDDASGGLDANTTTLDGSKLSPQELIAHATAVPFLAASRLVIVDGLLAAIGSAKAGGRRSAKKKPAGDDDDPLEPWRQAAAQLADKATMPTTTTLVLVEGEIGQKNPAFTVFAPIAKTVDFPYLAKDDLRHWIADAAKHEKLKISDRGLAVLAELLGSDLWLLKNEMAKLAAFAGGEAIDDATVRELVSGAQDAKFWDMTDAVPAGNEKKALTALEKLLVEGTAVQVLASMLVRSYRQLVIVKEMREARASQDEIARVSGVAKWKVDSTAALASRYSWDDLRTAYGKLLDADLNVKRGLQDDESSLQLLVHELCALAPRGAARPAYAR